ncbi:hypothetical protein CYMTET_21659 [Cymbomonas tetramitiformis]|uniref:Uncharacterized protein n=1 Tax=Cymbomonas tetramitiformis TaxID=36881 RepID=A0AAE0G1G1_9CHLO|nr:hypothetical protein CYMTET_21659 [Cymbomonas tetramitiformis]
MRRCANREPKEDPTPEDVQLEDAAKPTGRVQEFLKLASEGWEDYQQPRNQGDIRDVILMGVSISVLVFFAMQLYRLYAAIYDLAGLKTMAEIISQGSF